MTDQFLQYTKVKIVMVGLYSIFNYMYTEIRTRICSIRIRNQAFVKTYMRIQAAQTL